MRRRLRALVERLRASARVPARPFDGLWLGAFALAVRLVVVAWAAERFPPADDGQFYQVFAERIARGLGYTWLWPDGAVTAAAHYPVGYPGLLGVLYWALGTDLLVAQLANAVLGAAGVVGVHRITRSVTGRGPAAAAAVIVAVHPSLVGYTPALMTEGVSAAVLAALGGLAVELSERRRPWLGLLLLGFGCGFLTLVRPQLLVLSPVLGAVARARSPNRSRLAAGAAVLALSVAVCLPWTLRNCAQMDRCVLVSANLGWNLFIGSAPGATGSFVPLDELGVPVECRTVYGEGDKDRCFAAAAVRNLRERPGDFLRLIPAKLRATFDWSGAPGHYLHSSNPAAFDAGQKLALGVAEAVYQRLIVLGCVLGLAWKRGPRRRVRQLLALLAAPLLFVDAAYLAHLLLVGQVLTFGRAIFQRPDALLAAAAVAATAATHAVFFGAGRYGLVCVPLLAALFAGWFAAPEPASDEGRTPAPGGSGKAAAGF